LAATFKFQINILHKWSNPKSKILIMDLENKHFLTFQLLKWIFLDTKLETLNKKPMINGSKLLWILEKLNSNSELKINIKINLINGDHQAAPLDKETVMIKRIWMIVQRKNYLPSNKTFRLVIINSINKINCNL